MPDTLPSSNISATQPKIEEFSIDGKLNGTLADIKAVLGKLPFYLISSDAEGLTLVKVESRSINKKPYVFHIIKIKADGITVTYSLLQDTSVNLRRADVLKEISAILSMISDKYSINQGKFIQYVDSVLENLISGLSQTYTALYNSYDSMLTVCFMFMK